MQDTPSRAPTVAIAGDTITWYQDAPENTPADGWSLQVILTGPEQKTIAATVVSGQFLVTLTATESDAMAAGTYRWTARATLGGTVQTVAVGQLTLQPNPTALAGDTRSYNERVLAALRAKFEGRITADVLNYSIGGRSINTLDPEQLQRLMDKYRRLVAMEQRGGTLPAVAVTFGALGPTEPAWR